MHYYSLRLMCLLGEQLYYLPRFLTRYARNQCMTNAEVDLLLNKHLCTAGAY